MGRSLVQGLTKHHIKINGEELCKRYFEDMHDIALGLTTDGFAPWRKRKYTAWTLLLIIYNLRPEIQNHQKNILALSVIPSRKKPKDINSFPYPLVEELLILANGDRAFDARTGQLFCLWAFLIAAFGDIPAVSLVMKMKGHNAISPCRMCNIQGVRIPGGETTAHYVPLNHASHPTPGRIANYDQNNLPMRTHDEFISNANSVITASTRV